MADLPVDVTLTSLDAAREMGATALFEGKYDEQVRVVSIADYSMELCGGTHVTSVGQIGLFKIISEAGIGAGLRRIEAVTGAAAYHWFNQRNQLLGGCRAAENAVEQVPDKIRGLQTELKDLQRGTNVCS